MRVIKCADGPWLLETHRGFGRGTIVPAQNYWIALFERPFFTWVDMVDNFLKVVLVDGVVIPDKDSAIHLSSVYDGYSYF
jgi:hypothetical protein